MNTRKIGSTYEEKAARFLSENGLLILERNYRCPQGEIDIVARDGPYLVFIEVKYRTGKIEGASLWAVNHKKQKRISQAALWYVTKFAGNKELPCRFDVVGIENEQIYWIKNAFEFAN